MTRSCQAAALASARGKHVRIVGQNAEIGHHRAEPLQQRAQEITIGVVDRGAAALAAWLDHFVAGRKDRNRQPPPHFEFGQAQSGGERDVLRLQHGAGRQHDIARRHVLAGQPAIGAELQPARHRDAVAVDRDVFLHEHGVGADRHRRAGEYPDRLAGFQRGIGTPPGGQPAADDQFGVAARFEIGMADGVTIDRGIIERRQIDRRLQVGGGDAAARAAQRHPFGLRDRHDPFADQPLHLGQRQQRTGKCETIVGQLRHHAHAPEIAPGHAIGTACLSSRSAMASMSLRSTTGTRAAGSARVAGDRHDMRIVRMDQRLAVLGAVNFQLRKGVALEAFDQHQIDRRHLGDQVGHVPFRLLAQFVQDRPAPGRRDDHLGGAGDAVHEGILAGLVQIEAMMGVLERGHPHPPRQQARNELGDQCGFAGAAPAGEADDAHGTVLETVHGLLIAKRPAASRAFRGLCCRCYSAGVAAARARAWLSDSFGPTRAFSSVSQRLWCSLAQLRSTVPVPIASNAPSMPSEPI